MKIEYAPSKAKIERVLPSYVRRLRSRIDLKLVVMFGSYAENTYGWGSDVDLLVIALDPLENRGVQFSVLMDPNFPVELQPFGYTPDEFEEMLKARHPLLMRALSRGKILYATKEYKTRILRLKESLFEGENS